MSPKNPPPAKRPAKAAPADASARAPKPDPTDILSAEFVAGAAPGSELPPPTGAEIAFAGRSNVGKSSLINNLLQRKSLVRTSSTPGSTRQINLFQATARDGAVFRLVDLPGYGFAKRSKSELASWGTLIEGYLRHRVTLAAVVIIVDVRRGLEDDDRELIDFIEQTQDAARRPVEIIVVATKLDKVARSASRAAVATLEKTIRRKVIGFSAVTGEGRRQVWSAIRRAVLGTSASPAPSDRAAPAEPTEPTEPSEPSEPTPA